MRKNIAYCGIDVGLKSHAVCLLDDAQNVAKKYVIINDIEGFTKLEADLNKETKICLEPTGIYSINIFLYLKKKNYDVKFCKTDSSHDFRQAMFRSKKHDRFDALALAKYRIVNENQVFDGERTIEKMSLDSYSFSPDYQQLSDLVDRHSSAGKAIRKLRNKITGLIDLRFPEAVLVFPSDRGCKTIREALLHPKEKIIAGEIPLHSLATIQAKLKHSIGQYEMKRKDFVSYVSELNALEKQRAVLESSIKDQLLKMGYASLFNYYGLNTLGIALLVKDIRDIKRFYRYSNNGQFNKKRSLRAFKKFIGITVTSNQSGARQGGHKLAKTGNFTLRSILFMMAMGYIQTKPDKFIGVNSDLNPSKLKALYESLVARGVKKLIALTKVMDKIATDLFFILREHAGMNIKEPKNIPLSVSSPAPAMSHRA